MPYIQFYEICPAQAENETRIISVFHNENEFQIPQGNYAFIEHFCDECDCRRVFLQVLRDHKPVATIAYGWESLSFYKKEFRGFSDKDIKDIKGPTLESFQYQSEISDKVLNMFKTVLQTDKEYMGRLVKHYNLFKKLLKKNNRRL